MLLLSNNRQPIFLPWQKLCNFKLQCNLHRQSVTGLFFPTFSGEPRPNDVKNERQRIAAVDCRNLRSFVRSRGGGRGRRERSQLDNTIQKPHKQCTYLPQLTVKVRRWNTEVENEWLKVRSHCTDSEAKSWFSMLLILLFLCDTIDGASERQHSCRCSVN